MNERVPHSPQGIETWINHGLRFRPSFVNHNPEFNENMISLQLHLGEMNFRTKPLSEWEQVAITFTHRLLLLAHTDELQDNLYFESPEKVAGAVNKLRRKSDRVRVSWPICAEDFGEAFAS